MKGSANQKAIDFIYMQHPLIKQKRMLFSNGNRWIKTRRKPSSQFTTQTSKCIVYSFNYYRELKPILILVRKNPKKKKQMARNLELQGSP